MKVITWREIEKGDAWMKNSRALDTYLRGLENSESLMTIIRSGFAGLVDEDDFNFVLVHILVPMLWLIGWRPGVNGEIPVLTCAEKIQALEQFCDEQFLLDSSLMMRIAQVCAATRMRHAQDDLATAVRLILITMIEGGWLPTKHHGNTLH